MKKTVLKSERLFFIFTLIYMILFLAFNVIGSLSNSIKLVDVPLMIDILIHRLFSNEMLHIFENVFIWIPISFVLIIIIILQFNLKREKLLRTILLFEFFNMMMTLFISGISDAIITKDFTNTMLFTFYILLLWAAIAYFLVKFIVNKGDDNNLKEVVSKEEYKKINNKKK